MKMTIKAIDSAMGGDQDEHSTDGSRHQFGVVDRAMHVLRCLSEHPDGLTLTELSVATGLHKATAARFLKTLEKGGFASVDQSKTWTVGPALVDIAMRAQRRLDVRDVARPVMEELCRAANETVQMAILADDSIAYVDKVEPPEQPLRINTQVGSRRPIHCTGLGKLLAAFHTDPAEIERILKSAGMRRVTPQTITSLSDFQEEMARIRSRGYAIDDREYNELVTCSAAPIRDSSGRTVAGLSLSLIGVPIESARFGELAETLGAAADRISTAMGWSKAEDDDGYREGA